MKTRASLFIFLVAPVCVQANNLLDENRQLREKISLLQAKVNATDKLKPNEISKACLNEPLPSTPKSPNYSMAYSPVHAGNGVAKLIFWRESCADKSGTRLLVRAVPSQGSPYLGNVEFNVIQSNNQFNPSFIRFEKPMEGWYVDWSDNLLIPTTFVFNVLSGIFNPTKAMTIFQGTQKLSIPAGTGGSRPPGVNGSVVGYKSYSVTCKNITTSAVKKWPMQKGTGWNCKGLPLKPGDTVQTIAGVI